jgi:Secretion system C-terminal sorting domain/Beta-propeller repeat
VKEIIKLTFILCLLTNLINAQNFEWAKSIGSIGEDEGSSVTVDKNENLYIAGWISDTTEFNSGSESIYIKNGAFIAKYDPFGNFIWAFSIENYFDSGNRIYSINVDIEENIYVTGVFTGIVDFDPDANSDFFLTADPGGNAFIAKYDGNGNYIWAKNFTGSSGVGYGIETDLEGFIYIIGTFKNTVDFDPNLSQQFELTAEGIIDIFFGKYDSNGNFIWANSLVGSGTSDTGRSIAVDDIGNVFITGDFCDTVDFDPGEDSVKLIAVGAFDIFHAKYDNNGKYLWAKSIIGKEYVGSWGHDIEVDAHGDYYICGRFKGDILVAKYNTNGENEWFKTIGDPNRGDQAQSLTIDNSGNVYITGNLGGTADFDTSNDTANLYINGIWDIFVAAYDASGNYLWAYSFGNSSWDEGNDVAINLMGNVYVTGYFENLVDFDPGDDTYNLTSLGSKDVFFVKFSPSTVGIEKEEIISDILIYPNPTQFYFKIKLNGSVTRLSVSIFNLGGQELLKSNYKNIQSTEISLKNLKPGIYLVKIIADNETKTLKLIKE